MNKFLERFGAFLIPLALVALAFVARVFGVIPNFSPVGAIALFAGTWFNGAQRWWIPFAGLIASDAIMAATNTYGMTYLLGSPIVYMAFALVILIGMLNKQKNPLITLASVPAASIVFFIVTNFFVWLNPIPAWPSMYPMTWDGFVACYVAAIPFFKNTIASDGLYSLILFGAGYLATMVLPKSAADKQLKLEF
jgi:hypothetical protein